MSPRFTSHADVATDKPARYAKQLASHLGRHAQIREEEDGATRIVLGNGGSCLLTSGDGVLTLLAEAPTKVALGQVEDVTGRHLERFGTRAELAVQWRRAPGSEDSGGARARAAGQAVLGRARSAAATRLGRLRQGH
ncbi:DUF2218 domain-containing protein [Frankia sp. CNm7]|uniref:DUF2218 domain-containing protein n=1 Tax=Frankia nepalensis TaxID=1836974 RepID=A0A937RRA3_9ACTN|nr:DUF2218 domain-containing protein [Frankia nepalensis]MBL7512936.1 DUF2218 domain-containing protein [Frankia nepalensis]MBL7524680.1 DUF2218 domain-containing protein [Frankia nepalensis]MBL7633505.1 DUF2218 domain-containing protein [Frankia nepalensis]